MRKITKLKIYTNIIMGKYNLEYLKNLCPTYTIIKNQKNKLNRESLITYICECEKENTKSFRSIENWGILCKLCMDNIVQSKIKPSIYNLELLEKICPNYTNIKYKNKKLNRQSIITFTCYCGNIDEKGFRAIEKFGALCKECANKKRIEKTEITNTEKYGVKYPFQSIEIQNKVRKTYNEFSEEKLKKIREKTIQTNFLIYGKKTPGESLEVKQKMIQTNLDKYGVKYTFQSDIVKEKIKKTNLDRYGVEHVLQSDFFKEKVKQTTLDRYGVDHIMKCKKFKKKSEQTCLKNLGVRTPAKSKIVLNKIKNTNVDKWGVECVFQSEEIKEKIIQTNLKKYGVRHPMQNSKISEKASKSAYKWYDYILPSGKIIRLQGYEKYGIDILLKTYEEEDLLTCRTQVPEIWYKKETGSDHRYFTDIYIKSENKCIDVKSTWTYKKKQDIIELKKHACIDSGYKYETWIISNKGKLLEVC